MNAVTDRGSPLLNSAPVAPESWSQAKASHLASRTRALEKRLATFGSALLATAFQLASAGFSYERESTLVKCDACETCLDKDSPLHPLVLHKQKSPECPFFDDPARPLTDSPPCRQRPDGATADASIARTRTPPGGPERKSRPPGKYPEYNMHSARVASFRGWPLEVVKQSPDYLAKCGFFYIGSADRVRCYFCGITLRNWEAEDDPYQEHRNWAPKCTFIQTLDRPERHPEVTWFRPADVDAGPAPEGTSERPDFGGHDSTLSQPPRLPLSQSGADFREDRHGFGDQSEPSGVENSKARLLSSPTVQAVIGMGFPSDVVEKVAQDVSKSGQPVTAAELFAAVESYLQSQ